MRETNMPEPLTPEQIVEIRRLYHSEGWKQGRLARHFKRAIGTIGRIVRGETHQDVAMPRAIPESEIAASQKKLEEMLSQVGSAPQGLPEELKPKKPNPYT